jgi:hypothetical protein
LVDLEEFFVVFLWGVLVPANVWLGVRNELVFLSLVRIILGFGCADGENAPVGANKSKLAAQHTAKGAALPPEER